MQEHGEKMDQPVLSIHISIVILNLKAGQTIRWYVFLQICEVQRLQVQKIDY
jgi:hypothetical protein